MDKEDWGESFRNHSSWISQAKINQEIADLAYEKFKNSRPHHGMLLMLYGLSLECYLKAKALKMGYSPITVEFIGEKLENEEDGSDMEYMAREDLFSRKSGKSKIILDKKFANHEVVFFYKYCEGEITNDECRKHLENIKRAIKSGKYHVEKEPADSSYVENIDQTLVFCKDLMKKLKTELC